MAYAQEYNRPIPGAVATAGVSDRVDFLRKTYGLLGVALVAWAGITAVMMNMMTETSLRLSAAMWNGRASWFITLALFMAIGWGSQRLAMSDSSRGLQLGGLALGVLLQSIILQPMLWYIVLRFGGSATTHGVTFGAVATKMIWQAAGITMTIFVGLTATVFVTRKDFSFMRGALGIASFALLGIAAMSMIFGFNIGIVYAAAVAALMAGYILYETSTIMSSFPTSHYVAAALMLFGTVATLFRAILSILAQSRRD